MIQLLSLIKRHSHQQVRTAVEEAIALGCTDGASVRHLVEAADLTHARSALIELGALARFERPLPAITDYDGLLSPEVAP
jgi:glutamate-1-semialdehyde aminotransferase